MWIYLYLHKRALNSLVRRQNCKFKWTMECMWGNQDMMVMILSTYAMLIQFILLESNFVPRNYIADTLKCHIFEIKLSWLKIWRKKLKVLISKYVTSEEIWILKQTNAKFTNEIAHIIEACEEVASLKQITLRTTFVTRGNGVKKQYKNCLCF